MGPDPSKKHSCAGEDVETESDEHEGEGHVAVMPDPLADQVVIHQQIHG